MEFMPVKPERNIALVQVFDLVSVRFRRSRDGKTLRLLTQAGTPLRSIDIGEHDEQLHLAYQVLDAAAKDAWYPHPQLGLDAKVAFFYAQTMEISIGPASLGKAFVPESLEDNEIVIDPEGSLAVISGDGIEETLTLARPTPGKELPYELVGPVFKRRPDLSLADTEKRLTTHHPTQLHVDAGNG